MLKRSALIELLRDPLARRWLAFVVGGYAYLVVAYQHAVPSWLHLPSNLAVPPYAALR